MGALDGPQKARGIRRLLPRATQDVNILVSCRDQTDRLALCQQVECLLAAELKYLQDHGCGSGRGLR